MNSICRFLLVALFVGASHLNPAVAQTTPTGRSILTLIREIIQIAQQFNATSGPQTIRLTFPASRIVYQQDLKKQGRILIEGISGGNPTRAFVSLKRRPTKNNPNPSTTATWTEIPVNSQTGKIQTSINAPSGWYDLKIVTFRGSVLQAVSMIERVGVGEVFLIAGQSNAYGAYSPLHVAHDDRVSVLNVDAGGAIDTANLPMNFAQAGPGTITGPKGHLFVWAEMADELAGRLDAPILLFNVAHPGTSTQDWVRTKNGEENVVFGAAHPNAPYYHMRVVLRNYIRKLGVRAVLWHQGEYDGGIYTENNTGKPEDRVDAGTPVPGGPSTLYRLVRPTSADEYAQRLGEIVQASRSDAGSSSLAWVVARASYMPYKPPHFYGNGYASTVIQGQNKIIADKKLGNIFAGPNTDTNVSPLPSERPDGCHFGESVYTKVGKLWSDSLSNTFFSGSSPFIPSAPTGTRPGLMIGLDESARAENSAWIESQDPGAESKLAGFSTVVQVLDTLDHSSSAPEFAISIGPVPVLNGEATLWISSDPARDFTYQIYNQAGQEVLTASGSTTSELTEVPMNLSRLSPGMYIVQVELNQKVQRKKIVVLN